MESNYWKCKIKWPQKPSLRSDGLCFGVPKHLSENYLSEDVRQSFPSCEKLIRFLTKDQRATGTIKLIFKADEELHEAIEKGIYIQKFCLKLNVEKARASKPRPLQCYKYWGYGHVADECKSDRVCRLCCAVIVSEKDHKDCDQVKCCNCGANNHDATKPLWLSHV